MAMKPSSRFERMKLKPSQAMSKKTVGQQTLGGVAGAVVDASLAPAALVASGIANRPKGMDKKAAARRNAMKKMAGN